MRQAFTYVVPTHLAGQLRLGHAVLVPFGKRVVSAYVLELTHTIDFDPAKAKAVKRLLDAEPVFDARQLQFFRWIAEYYLSALGEVIATALPSAFKASSKSLHYASDEGVNALAINTVEGADAEVLRECISRPGLTRRGLIKRLKDLLGDGEADIALDRLLRSALVHREQSQLSGPGALTRVVRLVGDEAFRTEALPKPGKRQRAVLTYIAAQKGDVDVAEILADQGPYARTAIRKLVEKGVVEQDQREIRDAVSVGEMPASAQAPKLTDAQRGAVDAILGPPRPWLLHGVTGSGKTEVYLNAASEILKRGKDVLVLVPEIGLTPLLTGRFRARFGDKVAVLHSGLTGSQRLREWRRIRAGEAQVTVGARSALFAPFPNLGLLVVDEEHDDSYKQDEGVRYNARDMAVVAGHLRQCPVVLGSATPSIESYKNTQTGRYGLLELLTRPTPRPVPAIEMVDMNEVEKVDGQKPLLSPAVQAALTQCFDHGGKAIVLYNRRGFATFVQCDDCGAAYRCPSCGVALVLHQHQRTLTCHYCGFHRPHERDCGQCGGLIVEMGKGTERVEQVLAQAYPHIPIARMDADTTAARGAHHRILEDFRTGKTRMLVGTQIVAKGHDFPDVLLAVVVGADHVLMMPDFRAAERCFSLLTQLAGRAGRGDLPGRVLVQTHHPKHFALEKLGEYKAFYKQESHEREILSHPPFSRLCLVRIEGTDRYKVHDAANALAKNLRAQVDSTRIQVLGPAPAALPRLLGRWRVQLVLRGMDAKVFRNWLKTLKLKAPGKAIRMVVDVDPRYLM
jgi:primosomal protein N' (replication factor Y) (superfamily II helicase)